MNVSVKLPRRVRSIEALARARKSVAGGDSSTMRVLPYHPPLVADRGEGPWIYDLDGNKILDLNMAFGPLLFGHRPDFWLKRIVKQLTERGSQLGFPTELTYRVAERVQRLFPSMELMRFANSGTEAIASAVRLARFNSGRNGLVLFEGHYHGWSEAVFHKYHAPLESLGKEPGEPALPGTGGMHGFRDVFMAPWNDIDALVHCLDRHAGQIGAVLMEPVMGNGGLIAPLPGYLEKVREATKQRDIILIFDEVITGMRIAAGGAQARFGVKPDITVISKVLGGGVPIAAFGASRVLFKPIETGALFHGGVYSGNALVLAAAEAMLDEILTRGDALYDQLETTSRRLAEGVDSILTAHQIPHLVRHVGALISIVLTKDHVERIDDYRAMRQHGDFEKYIRFEHALLDAGVYIHPNMFEPLFPSTAHSEEDVAEALNRFEDGVRTSLVQNG
jgi:glutamate-1-semialdehyde 2,1-aminomutase